MRFDRVTTQSAFAAALFEPASLVPAVITAASHPRTRAGLNVYRNNVAAGLFNVLASRFPTVRRIVGDESFAPAARAFIAAHPPRSAVLMEYGQEFPGFVRRRGTDACFRYVADIADLELARSRAYHAADATPLSHGAFVALSGDEFSGRRVTLHPSVSLLKSRFPVISVWQSQQACGGDHPTHARGAEAALISRPFLDIEIYLLTDGSYAFLNALHSGSTIAEALKAGADSAAAFDLTESLSLLISSNIVVALQ
jgi:hypothetical protein